MPNDAMGFKKWGETTREKKSKEKDSNINHVDPTKPVDRGQNTIFYRHGPMGRHIRTSIIQNIAKITQK